MTRRRDDSGEYPAPKKAGVPAWAWLMIAIGGVGLVVCCGGFVALAMWGRTLPTVPEKVYEADDLLAAYKQSPAKMGDDFKDKRITVRGRITHFLGDSVLMGDGGTSITCLLPHSDAKKVSVGQTVKVRGTVTLGNSGGVWLNPAAIVD